LAAVVPERAWRVLARVGMSDGRSVWFRAAWERQVMSMTARRFASAVWN